ncbi:MAG: DUF58 domain-containing protein [Bryobacteraceae bacterium]
MKTRFWARLRAAVESSVRQQVTRAGLLYTFTIILVAMAAFASANNLLFLILAAMLATLLVSGLISRLSLASLELDLLLPEHIPARRKVAARIVVHNLKRWMPSFSIHLSGLAGTGFDKILYFPVIAGGGSLEETVELYFARRGTHRENSFQFSTRFPFGFTERRIEVTLRRDILVYPPVDAQAGFEELLAALTGEIEAHYRGSGHDFYRIRPYEASESARHVDWKATAHTGDLQVREFARDEEHLVAIYLDLDTAPEHAEWFEKGVDCCAFLAWSIAQSGARIHFRTQEFDARLPEEGDIYTILKYLALVKPAWGKAATGPDDENSFQIAISPNPERLASLGWGAGEERSACLLGLDAFAGAATGAPSGAAREPTAADKNVHHRHWNDRG